MEINVLDHDFPPEIDRGFTLSMVIKTFKGRRNVEVHLFRPEWAEEDNEGYRWDKMLGDPVDPANTDPMGSRQVFLETFGPGERDSIINFLQEQYGDRLASITSMPLSFPIPLGMTPLSAVSEGKSIGLIRFEKLPSYKLGIPLHGLFDLSQHEPLVEVKSQVNRPFTDLAPKNILVCQLRQIGDVLLATPAVELLHKAYPQARIHFLTEKKCAPVLENNPHLHKVWEIDKKALSHLGKELLFYRRVASQDFDLVVDFQQLPRCRWVVGFSRAHVRLSYTPPWYTRWLYNLTATPKDGYSAMAKASVLAPLGIGWNGERPRLYLSDAEKTWASDYLHAAGYTPGNDPLVTVDPTHRRDTRRWPAAHYAGLMDMVAQQRPGARFFMLYGPGEREDINAIASQVKARHNLIIPEEVISLRQMAAIINAADLHFGNCSSPRHFAVAVDTPTLVVLGSTSQAWTFPAPEHKAIALGLDCQPCNDNSCTPGHMRCLHNLTPDKVLPVLLQHLKAVSSRS